MDARGEAISYTQWEAWLAIYHDKLLVIAQAGADAENRGPEFAPDAASRAAQQAHLARLRRMERYPGCTFVNGDQLAKFVLSSAILDLLEKARDGAHARSGWAPYIAPAISLLVMLVTPTVADQWAKTLGVPVVAPVALVLATAGFALPLIYSRYFLMLGASDEPAGSRDREGYDALRENFTTGGLATHLYARWLTAFLHRVDLFFGDADMADRTLFPHAFGLGTPAPLWTAPAFDRCLLLALVYPIAAVFIMWAVSSHVGPAEAALGLPRGLSGWTRGLAVTAAGFSVFGCWQFFQTTGWISFIWINFAFGISSAVVLAAANANAFPAAALAQAIGIIFIVFFIAARLFSVFFPGAVAVAGISVFVINDGLFHSGHVDLSGTIAVAFALSWLSAMAIRNRRQGVFLLSFFVIMALGCLIAAYTLSSQDFVWYFFSSGPILLFLGLLTLINAPFDWASLGLTRALLRRGLELKSWWPFALAVADALCAAGIIALLAITMVIGVQAFDALAIHGGGGPVLPLTSFDSVYDYSPPKWHPLLDGIAAHPEAPEYWWVYALLLSTMIPSLINLAIGGTALVRAVPGLPQFLLRLLPATGGVPAYDRAWIAAVLTMQAALGAILGVAVQALVAWGLLFHVMPAAGLGLLDLCRNLAMLDLPARAIAFFTGA